MKHSKFWHFLCMIFLISPFIGACVFSYPERRLSNFHVDLDHPFQGAVLGLGETFLLGTLYHPDTEVSQLVFYANGRNIGETSDLSSDGDLSYAEINWTPPAVGEYLLQVEAKAVEGPDVISGAVRVCVIDFEIEGGTFGDNFGYAGPCDVTVTRDEFPTPGTITLAARAAPARLTYNDVFHDPRCSEVRDPVISFNATVEDPPDDVVFVVVYYSMTFSSSAPFYPGETRTHALILTQTSSAEPSTEIYTGSTDELSASLSNYFYGIGVGEVVWTARAIGRSGEIVLEDGPHTIPASSSCGLVSAATASPPTLTPTPEPSELTCPPGTYYAPVTNQCIPIMIEPTRKGGGGQACSSYGNNDSCSAAGCSWDGQSQSCK